MDNTKIEKHILIEIEDDYYLERYRGLYITSPVGMLYYIIKIAYVEELKDYMFQMCSIVVDFTDINSLKNKINTAESEKGFDKWERPEQMKYIKWCINNYKPPFSEVKRKMQIISEESKKRRISLLTHWKPFFDKL